LGKLKPDFFIMKIYTRTGDTGETSLIDGRRISKADARIEAFGSVDELNAFLGLLRDQPVNENRGSLLVTIQDRLFTIGSNLAVPDQVKVEFSPALTTDDITFLELAIDRMDQELPPMRSFILPGGHPSVSFGHVARTVCRRAERHIVLLSAEHVVDPLIIQYMNRLSDFLFVLCRKMAIELKIEEVPWKPAINKS
jgi:cob(I)alamin adenosyltransferase